LKNHILPSKAPIQLTIALGAVLLVGSLLLGMFLGFVQPHGHNGTVLDTSRAVLSGQSMIDSWLPMGNALQVWRSPAGQDIYAKVFFAPGDAYQYPPAALFFAMMLDAKPAPVPTPLETFTLFAALAVVALSTAYVFERMMTLRGFELGSPWQRALRWIFVAALSLTFYPVVRAFELGQAQLWIDALFAAALAAWLARRPALSGVLVGAICLLKPQLSLLLVWGIIRKQWSFAGAIAAFCAVTFGVALIYFGLQNHLSYLKVLSVLSQHGESVYPNQSVNGLLGRLMSLQDPESFNNLKWRESLPPYHPLIYWGTMISSILILLPALLWRSDNDLIQRTLDLCTMALSATIASPIAWNHHYGVVFPIFAVALISAWGRWVTVGMIGISYVVASHFLPFTGEFARSKLNFVQSYLFFAMLLLLAVLYELRTRSSPAQLHATSSS
jgi:alpha-1,2-mannosyltransferase